MNPESRSDKVPFANALRGVAALAVIISHHFGVFWYGQVTYFTGIKVALPSPPPYVAALQIPGFGWGSFGVGLFFIISGFVIPFSFQKYDRAGFLVGRFFRIYPTYWAGLLLMLLVVDASSRSSGGSFPNSWAEVAIQFALGTRDLYWSKPIDAVVWTLEVELKFYLISALILPWLRNPSLKAFIAPALLTVGAVIAAHYLDNTEASKHWYWTAWNFPYVIFMFIGVAINFAYRRAIGYWQTSLIITSLFSAFSWCMTFGHFAMPAVIPSYALALGFFILCMAFPRIPMRIPTIRFWADISYPLYATHAVIGYCVLSLMINYGSPPFLASLVTMAIVTAVASAVHFTIEDRFHREGRKWAKRFQAPLRS